MVTKGNGEEDISLGGRGRGRHQPLRKMERKISATKENGEEDMGHEGKWRGRHQPWRKRERKTSTTEEEGEEDMSHGGSWRGRYQPRRKREKMTVAATRSEACPSRPAPLFEVSTSPSGQSSALQRKKNVPSNMSS